MFRGRTLEIASVAQRVIASRLIVLFGKSGLGKTSLLNAGVFRRLRDQAFLPVRVRMRPGVRPVPLVVAALHDAAASHTTDRTVPDSASLWELFKTATLWRDQTLLTPVLVFDQFEEAFTLLTPDERRALADEIGALVSGSMPEAVRRRQRALPEADRLSDVPPQLRIMLVMREEYLAALQELSPSIPHLFQDRVRLLPLSDAQATEAIREPASLAQAVETDATTIAFKTQPFQYSDDAIELILKFLHGRSGQVEPWALQILCMHVERHIVPAMRATRGETADITVTGADLGGEMAMKRVLSAFYRTTIAKVVGKQGRCARELCDSGLINDQGRRLSLERDQIHSDWNVADETLDFLVQARLLRREPRLESTFYEISHDTLAETIVSNRPFRLPRRFRTAAKVFGVMAAIVLVVWAWQTSKAVHEKNQAARARAQSEQLVTFLIGEDLLERLQRSGQMVMVEDVQRNVQTYLDGVKADAPTRGSEKAKAFAQINNGDLASLGGRLEESRVAYQAAIDGLRSLRDADRSDTLVQGGLAKALEKAADIAVDQGHLRQAVTLREEALALRKDLAASQPKDDRVQRRLAAAYVDLANLSRKQGRVSDASRYVEESVRLIGRQRDATAPEWDYVRADSWDARGENAGQERDYAAAEAAHKQQREVAMRVRKILPFEWQAQYQYGLASYRLANLNPRAIQEPESTPIAGSDSAQAASEPGANDAPTERNREAVQKSAQHSTHGHKDARNDKEIQADVYAELHETIATMVRWEPRNRRWSRELAAAGLWLGWGEELRGRRAEAVKIYRGALRDLEELSRSEGTSAALKDDLIWAHRFLADVLPGSEGLEHIDAALAIANPLLRLDPTDRDRTYEQIYLEIQRGGREEEAEHLDAALAAFDRARSMLDRISPVDPTDGTYFDYVIACHLARARVLAPSDGKASVEAARRAVDAAQTALHGNPRSSYFLRQHGAALRQLGARQQGIGDAEAARQSYTASLTSLRQAAALERRDGDAADSWHEAFLTFFNGLAPLGQERRDRPAVLSAYRDALAAAQKAAALAPAEAAYRSDLGRAYRRIGDSLQDGGAPGLAAAARDAYRRAAAAQETAVALAPTEGVYRSNLGLAYQQVGDLLRDDEVPDLAGADDAYGKAEQAFRKAAALQNRAEYWNRLFLLYFDHLALLRTKQRRASELPEMYRRARAAAETAVALAPSEAVYHSNLHVARRQLGELLRNATPPDVSGALAEYRRALTAIGQAVALEPANAEYQLDLGRAQRKTAGLLGKQEGRQQLSEAATLYLRSIEAARRAIRIDARSASAWNLLALSQFDRASALADETGRSEVLTLYRSAISAAERATALDPKESVYRTNLAHFHLETAGLLEDNNAIAAASAYERAIAVIRADADPARQAAYAGVLGESYSSAEAFCRKLKSVVGNSQRATADTLPQMDDRSAQASGAANDQLALVTLLLALHDTKAVPGSSRFRAEALNILRSLDSDGKLPAAWKQKLGDITRQ